MKKNVWQIILAVFLIVMVVAAVNVFLLGREYRKGIHTYEELEQYVTVEESTDEEENSGQALQEDDSKIAVDLNIDFDGLSAVNDELVGWIYYEPLSINYPIVRGNDNDYYTQYTFEKEKNSSGAIFMDFLNKPDFSHFNTIIYGHNMRNGTMFGSLKKILSDPSIVEENPYFYIFTRDDVRMYEICSAYITNDSSHTYDLIQTTEEQQEYLDYIRESSQYDWNSTGSLSLDGEEGKLVTLSTCHGLHSKNRTVIHGVLVEREDR